MVAEDFSKDPPLMPQHLNLTLLNMPMFVEGMPVVVAEAPGTGLTP